MTTFNSKNDIILSLTNYLPQLSTSLNGILNYLHNTVGNIAESNVDLSELLDQLGSVINVLKKIHDEMTAKNEEEMSDEDKAIFYLFKINMKTIITGLKSMLDWIRETDKNEELLKQSIDTLYQGSQQTLQLVNMLLLD